MYTLIVLEAAVKNCGVPFASHVCKNEFLDELIKGVKKDNSTEVHEKVLALIQSWADSFRNIPECSEVSRYYDDLKNKGVEFPATDLDTFTPIITPKRVSSIKYNLMVVFVNCCFVRLYILNHKLEPKL